MALQIGRNIEAFPVDPESPELFRLHVTLDDSDVLAHVTTTGKSSTIAQTDGWGFKFRRNGRDWLVRVSVGALPEPSEKVAFLNHKREKDEDGTSVKRSTQEF